MGGVMRRSREDSTQIARLNVDWLAGSREQWVAHGAAGRAAYEINVNRRHPVTLNVVPLPPTSL